MDIRENLIPYEWRNKLVSDNEEKIDVFETLFKQYEDEEILAYFIKKNNQISKLSKKELFQKIKFICDFFNYFKNKNSDKQLKILGIIGSSEESFLIMAASAILACHHCICFEDLSIEAIKTRIEIFMPNILICKKINNNTS